MSEETLMTAAHRLNRFFRIDMQNGGLVVDETLAALETLSRQVDAHDGSEPELLRTSRDCVTRLQIDMNRHGGMVSILTEISFDTLVKAIRAAGGRQ